MKFTAALIALTAVSGMVQPLAEPESEFLFTNFVKQYGKKYETSEFFKRYTIFKENLALIRNHNAGNHTYTLGLNEFADMDFTEFKRQMMGKRPDNRAYARSQNSAKLDMVNIPTSVDWTTKGAVTPIKNQGQCGSCWAFSSTGSLEGAYFIKNGNLVSFSEQQLVDCSGSYGNQGCSGGLMDDAFEYIIAKGLCTEASYPYTAQDGTCQASSCTNALASSPVKGYKDVQSDSESALMAAVAQQPVSVAIEADQSVFQFYKSGVMSSSGCGTQLDHGVLVVGYGTSSGQDFWKVKNSWGASWGESGYIRLGRGAGGSGICGLLTEPSYPTM